MAKYHRGYEDINVRLLNFVGEDLGRQCVMFGNIGEFYEGIDKYDPEDPRCIKIVDEIISGKTFPKYAFEGHSVSFQINNISRICLAQLTRERGFFCSASGDVRPLTQDFVIPAAIYDNKTWMAKLYTAQKLLEELYIEMCEAEVPYMESRYLGLHCQTISICYNAPVFNFMRSCNTRTENNFADEINYIYRLMLNELHKAVKDIKDPLSKRLWTWLLTFADNKKAYTRDHTYNNDFDRFELPNTYVHEECAHNDWRKSSWKLELEKIYKERPELLFPGEKEMIERWLEKEKNGEELPTTYDSESPLVAKNRIKTVDYYEKDK